MSKWSMVIDLDKCVACQACSIACRFENNTPVAAPDQAELGRAIRWNDVFPLPVEDEGEYPNAKERYMTRPCMHCENPPCTKVCPVGATYQDEDGIIRQNYARCIGCRLCTVGCPYTVRYFNWSVPDWVSPLTEHLNPDRVEGRGALEGPSIRPRGVVEKCTYCIHRLQKAHAQAEAEGRDFRSDEYVPACVQTCTGKARFFGDLDDPNSTVSQLSQKRRAFRLLEEAGTNPKTIYLQEG
ncbi:MAG: 4Fe-4S dicluster domain-containing protein [Anaerolineales bacterium]|nr:4Fe-4S dicluster domain-containing protein [Anaerolineales bacterium]